MVFRMFDLILLLGLCFTSTVSGQCATPKKYGQDCRYDCHCAPGVTCDRTTGCPLNSPCAAGWDGQTCQRQNVARSRSTYQSSTSYNSSYAVDGDERHTVPCSHTREPIGSSSWWTVVLSRTHSIYWFEIFNRDESCGDVNCGARLNSFAVYVGSQSSTQPNYKLCYQDTTTGSQGPGNIIYKNCTTPLTGNLVRITAPGRYLTLCEVLIYVCSDGTHGEYCNKYCGECKNNTPCNKETGICPIDGGQRCKDGYKPNRCTECSEDRWGGQCQNLCGACRNNAACDKNTGVCPPINGAQRCKDNYKPNLCTDCLAGRWGSDCTEICGHCWKNATCIKTSGSCPKNSANPRCAAGYKGESCKDECDPGEWGEDCNTKCGNCRHKTSACDKKNGDCPPVGGYPTCEEGYTGSRCMDSNCSKNTYGPGCKYSCHCKSGIMCDPFLGCNGSCGSGWDGPTCQRQNVALNCPTAESSSISNADYKSEFAVDGNTRTCSHTTTSQSSNWNVTLKDIYRISRFRIYNRAGFTVRLSNFTLSVGNSSVSPPPMYQLCYQDISHSPAGPGLVIDGVCNNSVPIAGNVVRVSVNVTPLTLCEVQIYVCTPEWYGETCQRECEKRDSCKRCDVTGLKCQECVSGRWGNHCQFHCGNCWNDNNCNKEDRQCPEHATSPRCAAGYKGRNCTTVCDPGTWGPDCNSKCGECFNDTVCNVSSGNCPSTEGNLTCALGYQSPQCSEPCTNRMWGPDCQWDCGKCFKDASCDPVTGECTTLGGSRCNPGYKGSLCNTSCINGRHGPDCIESCGFCADGPTFCDTLTGACPQRQSPCKEGYTGEKCKIEISSSVGIIVGAVVGAVVLAACVVAGVILYRKRHKRTKGGDEHELPTKHENDGFQESPAEPRYVADVDEQDIAIAVNSPDVGSVYENEESTAVPIDEFAEYVQDKKSSGRFKSEFEKFPVGLHAPHKAADLPHNKVKSRYKNLVAYDHSRVILEVHAGSDESDYINACYINGYDMPKKFIASQGATDPIINEFIRMIWEKNVGKVVMVTNLVEDTKTKCIQYWPNQGSRRIGMIEVNLLEEEVYAYFTTRNLRLTHSKVRNKSLDVRQFHFTAWPDHGVPSHATALLDFRDKVLGHETLANGPMMVHCSAGIGRTGTFIALDNLINQAKQEGVLDVQGCVKQLRKQRVNMIQTQEQYEFLHEALVEALKLKQASIQSVDFSREYAELCTVNPTTGETKMAGQFEVLREFKPVQDKTNLNAALKPENASKNRSNKILAADGSRPFLSTPVTGCNDYINAAFLPGYKLKRGFIVTQTPMPNTAVDFWRLVYEQSISTIVMLDSAETRDKSVGFYLPDMGGKVDPFEVEVMDMEEREDFSVWTYQLAYKKAKVTDPIKHFRCNFWQGRPSSQAIPSLLSVIQCAEDWQKQTGSDPILVYCRDGVSKSGLYCAASSVVERVKVDQDVNIIQTVKQMRSSRPYIIPDLDQFHLLHQIVLVYLENFNTYANFSS